MHGTLGPGLWWDFYFQAGDTSWHEGSRWCSMGTLVQRNQLVVSQGDISGPLLFLRNAIGRHLNRPRSCLHAMPRQAVCSVPKQRRIGTKKEKKSETKLRYFCEYVRLVPTSFCKNPTGDRKISGFVLFAAWKRGFPRKFAPCLVCQIKKRSF